jgi:hypothetical protein
VRVEQIDSQLRVITEAISLDLLDNELGVSFHEELPDPSDKTVLNLKSRASKFEEGNLSLIRIAIHICIYSMGDHAGYNRLHHNRVFV